MPHAIKRPQGSANDVLSVLSNYKDDRQSESLREENLSIDIGGIGRGEYKFPFDLDDVLVGLSQRMPEKMQKDLVDATSASAHQRLMFNRLGQWKNIPNADELHERHLQYWTTVSKEEFTWFVHRLSKQRSNRVFEAAVSILSEWITKAPEALASAFERTNDNPQFRETVLRAVTDSSEDQVDRVHDKLTPVIELAIQTGDRELREAGYMAAVQLPKDVAERLLEDAWRTEQDPDLRELLEEERGSLGR
jgi:hypothetical protein